MAIYFKHNELTKALQIFEEIAFAYVFGSSKDEIVNEGSDIDIAVYFIKNEFKDVYASFYSQTCRQYEDDSFWMKKQLEYRGYEVQWNN